MTKTSQSPFDPKIERNGVCDSNWKDGLWQFEQFSYKFFHFKREIALKLLEKRKKNVCIWWGR